MRRYIYVLFLVFFSNLSAQTIEVDSFYSPSMSKVMKYKVVLPEGYMADSLYPVCYLLHGYGGSADAWLENTKVLEYAKEYKYVFVLPSAGNSWYVNSFTKPEEKIEDYMVYDLPRRAASKFAIDTTEQALIGLSMGGYGTLVLGLRNPDKYKLLGPMSASMDVPGHVDKLTEYKRDGLRPSILEALGSDSTSYWDEHDPFILIEDLPPDSVPYIYITTGIDETFTQRIDFHRDFTNKLRALGIKYEYHETPGTHDFKFWDRELGNILRISGPFLRKEK
jgi:S-formylglutathione hydrolase FrmB